MIQFDLKRFGKLARWMLVRDRRYYKRYFLQILVLATLAYIVFTAYLGHSDPKGGRYNICAFLLIISTIAAAAMGPGYMFYSMDGKHDRQTLLMLPASNLEKYVMRYVTWMLLLPLALAAFLIADGLQYIVNVMLGHEWVQTVIGYIAEIDFKGRLFGPNPRRMQLALGLLLLWIHSLYAVGATFFRSRKHNWVLSSVVMIACYVLLVAVFGWVNVNITWLNTQELFNLLFLVLAVLNFWLSYRLFCRQQVIGRFFNM